MDSYKALHALMQEGSTQFPNLILRYREELDLSDADLGILLYEYYQESKGKGQSIALRRALDKAAALWEAENTASSTVLQVDMNLKTTLDAAQQLMGRPLSTRDVEVIARWHHDFRFDKELILHIITTCRDLKKFHLAYMDKVAESWYKDGIRTKADALEAEALRQQRRSLAADVGSYLGLRKVISKPEARMLLKWSEEWGFSKEAILLACDQVVHTDKPSFRYVDAVLTAWKDEGILEPEDIRRKLASPRTSPSKVKTPRNHPEGRTYDHTTDEEWIRLSIQNAARKQDKP